MAQDANLQMESLRQGLPVNQVKDIVRRIQSFNMSVEDNTGLQPLLGMSQLHTLQCGFGPNGRAQDRIDNICYMITRTYFDEPTRVKDFSVFGSFTNCLRAQNDATGQNKVRDFLFQIMLGLELFVRLRAQIVPPSYSTIITSNISCMIVAANQFKSNVQITEVSGSNPLKYNFKPLNMTTNAEGLKKFAEVMRWPYLAGANSVIDAANRLLSDGHWPTGPELCDWLYGLALPGKYHRRLVMSALVQASPSLSTLGAAPFYDNGVVLQGQGSYWPQRTALGRVLGGLPGVNECCGWVGPCPAPRGVGPRGTAIHGWVFVSCEKPVIPTPLITTVTSTGQNASTNPADYITPTPPSPVPNHSGSRISGLNMDYITTHQAISALLPGLYPESYKASIDFVVNGVAVKYTIHRDPIFITAPPCVGNHPMLRTLAEKRLSSVVPVSRLRNTSPPLGELLIINAQGEGDETVARAWCAEHGKNAIIRRNLVGSECCFSCACTLAVGDTGLGINVVIWSK